jgi:hypothetical protein
MNVLDMEADMVPPLVTNLTLSVRVAVWIREPGSGSPTHVRANSEPSATEGPGEPGSWRPTHRRVWLIGTGAEQDSRARLVRLWARFFSHKLRASLFSEKNKAETPN